MRRAPLLALLAALAAFPTPSTAATRWVTVQLTDNDVGDFINTSGRPLSNACAVWHEEVQTTNYQVFLLRIEPGVVPATDAAELVGSGSWASVNDACTMAWREGDQIVLHDGTSEVWRSEDGVYANEPSINNLGHVVWHTNTGVDADVYLYDQNEVTRLTDNGMFDRYPRIADNGHVAWRHNDGNDHEVVVYQGTPDPSPLTDNSSDDTDHRINNSGQVVWVNYENPDNGRIMLYDGETTSTVFDGGQNDLGYQKLLRINDNGYIVWHSRFDGCWEIMLYDPAVGVREIPGVTHNIYPTINNHQHVAWVGYSRYDPEDGLTEGAVYLDDTSRVRRISDSGVEARWVAINDVGHVMWSQFDGNDWEIMLAVRVEVPEVEWASTYGGDQWDAAADVIETADKGYLVAGSTRSFGAAEADAWVVKLDPLGAVEWQRRYGGPGNDIATCIHEVPDGYILAGTTASFGAGSTDAWLVKINESGTVLWERAYGGPEKEEMAGVEVLEDGTGNFVFAATSWSFDSGGVPEVPYSHIWLVRVNQYNGDIIWQKLYALSPYDRAWSVEQIAGGRFIVGGTTYAPGLGNGDFWVLELLNNGVIGWQRAYGQNEWVPADPWFHYMEWNAFVHQTPDGGYLLAGTSQSNNTYVPAAWVVKLNPLGTIEWEHWGGVPNVTDVLPLDLDGQYQVLGRSGNPYYAYPSFLDNLTESATNLLKSTADAAVYPLPSRESPRQASLMIGDLELGQLKTTYVRDPALHDELAAIAPTWDWGYVVAGSTGAHWSDLASGDAWVLKLDSRGRVTEECEAISSDDEYVTLPGSTNPMTVATAATVTDTDIVPSGPLATTEGTELTAGDGCQVIPPDLVDLAATGQTTSYAAGDDGDLQAGVPWPTSRFRDLGDGTMRDLLTGLVWLQDANCMASSGYDADGLGTWVEIFPFVEALNAGEVNAGGCGYTGGHGDWRVPNVREMESLVNAERPGALTWLEAEGFSHVCGPVSIYRPYWTSTTSGDLNKAWFVHVDGGLTYSWKDVDTARALVWPVREGQTGAPDPTYPANLARTGQTYDDPAVTGDDGELQWGVAWPAPRFLVQDDGGVLDGLTGLVWLKSVNCLGGGMPWSDTLTAVADFNADPGLFPLCGYSGDAGDWRLPNRREFLSLLQYRAGEIYWPLPDDHPFLGLGNYTKHWTSTTYAADATKAWWMWLANGVPAPLEKYQWYTYVPWPVRGTTSVFVLFRDGFESGDTSEWTATE